MLKAFYDIQHASGGILAPHREDACCLTDQFVNRQVVSGIVIRECIQELCLRQSGYAMAVCLQSRSYSLEDGSISFAPIGRKACITYDSCYVHRRIYLLFKGSCCKNASAFWMSSA